MTGMFVTICVSNNTTVDNIFIFDFADCVDKYLCDRRRFPIMGSDELVMQLSIFTSCLFYW